MDQVTTERAGKRAAGRVGERILVRALSDDGSLVVGPGEAGARIEWRGPEHAILAQAPVDRGSTDWVRTRVVLGPAERRVATGFIAREVLIDGWRVEVELEVERRALLRARARRPTPGGSDPGAQPVGGRRATEIRADIPGRVTEVGIAPGDAVTAGQPLLVIEAMKMLNELRAPRDGVVELVAVAAGQGVELGDLLVRLK